MAEGFLTRWLPGSRADPSVEEARGELDRLARDAPAFLPVLGWLRDILPELTPRPGLVRVAPGQLPDRDQARVLLAEGTPLLRRAKVMVDGRAFGRRWRRMCSSLDRLRPDGAAAALARSLRSGRLGPPNLVADLLAGRSDAIAHVAATLDLDPELTATVLRYVLFPGLVTLDCSLSSARDGIAWGRGYCPTCGSWPLLAELRGLEQTRFLRCGLCAAGWEMPRLACPFCGCGDHARLAYWHGEGDESRGRAAACDACRGYVKTVTTLAALPPLRLLVADAATLHLDLAAAGRGYRSPP